MMEKTNTIVYIDGYNFYYGLLSGRSHFKWLDIVKLFQTILQSQNPNSEIVKIKYFTAMALGQFARHGNKSTEAQQAYHRALEVSYPDVLEIILGSHVAARKRLPAVNPVNPNVFDKTQRSPVWVLEEKKTDVQIALAMYKDVVKENCQQVVLCSNDSDLAPALQEIRAEKQDFNIGVVMPIRPAPKGEKSRRISGSLDALATWTRNYIRDEELQVVLLPEKIPTHKKTILKPSHW
jgi:uncharacterized LabA/DUF88 family protein